MSEPHKEPHKEPHTELACFNRRTLISGIGAAAGVMASGCAINTPQLIKQDSHESDWLMADRITADIKAPQFAKKDFIISDFGAYSGEDASDALSKAIKSCHNAGGGRVVVPKGIYMTGPVHLLSNVNLHLSEGAVLKFVTDPNSYLPEVLTRWEGMELMGFSPLVYAHKQNNIAITGSGTLDGQASNDNWWPWKGNKEWGRAGFPSQADVRDRLMVDVEAGTEVSKRLYGSENYLRPPFVQFYECENVLLEDITIVRSPFWLVNPVLCKNVTVRGVHFESLGPNSDGCNPESCSHVLIENCFFDTGDDCIALKSGRNADGRRIGRPCENIVIRNCQMRAGHGGVVLGSEISGGARNIFVENCHMSSPDLERGIRIKTNSIRGGTIEHLRFRNIIIGQVKDAIVINFYYEEGDAGQFDPQVQDIVIENLICSEAERVFQIRGFKRAPIKSLKLSNIFIAKAKHKGIVEHVNELVSDYVVINGMRL